MNDNISRKHLIKVLSDWYNRTTDIGIASAYKRILVYLEEFGRQKYHIRLLKVGKPPVEYHIYDESLPKVITYEDDIYVHDATTTGSYEYVFVRHRNLRIDGAHRISTVPVEVDRTAGAIDPNAPFTGDNSTQSGMSDAVPCVGTAGQVDTTTT